MSCKKASVLGDVIPIADDICESIIQSVLFITYKAAF